MEKEVEKSGKTLPPIQEIPVQEQLLLRKRPEKESGLNCFPGFLLASNSDDLGFVDICLHDQQRPGLPGCPPCIKQFLSFPWTQVFFMLSAHRLSVLPLLSPARFYIDKVGRKKWYIAAFSFGRRSFACNVGNGCVIGKSGLGAFARSFMPAFKQ